MEGSRPTSSSSAMTQRVSWIARALRVRKIRFGLLPKQKEPVDNDGPARNGKLEDVIAGEIVPRLMLLHRQARPSQPQPPAPPSGSDLTPHVADFTDLILRQEAEIIETYLRSLMKRGFTLEMLLIYLMAPAARRLGQMWEDDTLDFVEVTVGTSRLQHVLHHLTFPTKKVEFDPLRRFLLLPAPDEQHTFGLVTVAETLRRNGWQVQGIAPMEPDEIRSLVKEQWFGLVGFSLSCERLITPLTSTIQLVRRFSKNKSVKIMVGGRMFLGEPASRPDVGADYVAIDAQDALDLAEEALAGAAFTRGLKPS